MSVLELQEQRLNLQDELKGLLAAGEAEKRELNEEENSKVVELKSKIDELDKSIEEEQRKLNNNNSNKENKTMKEVRLFDLIKGIANNSLSDEQREYVDGNTIKSANIRAAIQATVADHGKENVPMEKQPLEVAIRNASVLDKIGATWFPNAVGDLKLVKYSGSNTNWVNGENLEAADGAGTFSEMTLSPKRLAATLTISRQFLAQSPENAEAILIADLGRAIGTKIDQTLFRDGVGSQYEPAGLFSSANTFIESGTALTAVTFHDILDLEEKVEEKNGTDFMFISAPAVKYQLRGTQMASGLEMVWEKNEIDGRKAVVSNNVLAKGLLCLDPKDLACASWDYELIVDPYTLAANNQIKVVVNYLFDAKLRGDRIHGEIFS